MTTFPVLGQGPGHFIPDDGIEKELDDRGFTNPNLHRRIDPKEPTDPELVAPSNYSLGIYGPHSYRTQTLHTHDEESTTSEIP